MGVILEVRNVHCENCGKTFQSHFLSDFSYGERLIYACDGMDFVHINFIEDFTFIDLSNRIDNILRNGLYDKNRINIFNECIKAVCDNINGKEPDPFRFFPKCEACGSDHIKVFPNINPQSEVVEVKRATHMRWNSLSDEDKDSIITMIIDRID